MNLNPTNKGLPNGEALLFLLANPITLILITFIPFFTLWLPALFMD